MNQFGNTNWVETIKMHLPEHMSALEQDLDIAMTQHSLTDEEAHGAALAAAIASGNNELAFEISVNSTLFGSELRALASVAAVDNTKQVIRETYVLATDIADVQSIPYKLTKLDLKPEERKPFAIYSLACGVVYGSKLITYNYLDYLKSVENMTDQQLDDIVSIAAVVGSIIRVAI